MQANKVFGRLVFVTIMIVCLLNLGCNGDASKGWGPIFYNICQEVELDEAVVKGNIGSMVETKSYLYCLNGYVWRKNKYEQRGWNKQNLPFNTDAQNAITSIACDDSYIYAIEYNIESKVASLYYSPLVENLSWNAINYSDGNYYPLALFDNKATPAIGKREAYFACVHTSDYSQYKVYKFNGATYTEITSLIKDATHPEYQYVTWITSFTSDNTSCPLTAAWISANGGITTFATDGLLSSNVTNLFYHVSDGTINTDQRVGFSYDGKSWDTSVNPDLGKISYRCASYYRDENKNSFIYLGKQGSSSGLTVVKLNANTDVPTTTLVSPTGSNYSSCLGDMNPVGIFPLPLGSGNLYVGGVIYLSTKATSNTNKLWGYYPSRNTWNCE